MMMIDALPFKVANSPWLKRMVRDLDNRVEIKSKHTYAKEVKKEGKIVKRRSRTHVSQNVTIAYAAAADLWSSKGQDDYLGINAMFVDVSWRWQKIVVACRPFEVQHSGENLRSTLQKESDKLELPTNTVKVYVTDTASDIVAGRRVPGYSAISCSIHKLMLVGNDAENAVGTEEVAEALKAARQLVTHSRHCGPFHRTMKKFCKRNGHNFTKLVGHVKTRWNSNRGMVSRLLEHRNCIQLMENDEAVPNMPIIETAQWRILKQLNGILAPMERVTKVWESETEPTMPTVGVELYNLSMEWQEMIEKEEEAYYTSSLVVEPAILQFLRSLHSNLKRRFPDNGMDTDLAAWGNVLHPRYKVLVLEYFYNILFSFFQGVLLKEIGKYDSTIERLQEFLKSISSQPDDPGNDAVESRTAEERENGDTPAERLLKEKSGDCDIDVSPGDISQELAVYNKLPKPPVKETVLKFWSENEALLPQLSKAARVTLSVPCASATVERTFKVGVHQVTNHRSKLSPKTVEGLILSKANSGRVNMIGIDDEEYEDSSSNWSDSSSDYDEDSQLEMERFLQPSRSMRLVLNVVIVLRNLLQVTCWW